MEGPSEVDPLSHTTQGSVSLQEYLPALIGLRKADAVAQLTAKKAELNAL